MRERNSAPRFTIFPLIPSSMSRNPNSLQRMEVPSTETPFVRITASPVAISAFLTRLFLFTVPMRVADTIGRVTPSVISVCPPQRAMPSFAQRSWRSLMISHTFPAFEPSGRRRVTRSHRGTAPEVAISFAFTSTE